jgi:transcriptional antiterminator Rof (Rho-off)
MDWMAQEQERGITITCSYNLFLNFPMRQGEAFEAAHENAQRHRTFCHGMAVHKQPASD